MKLKFFTIFLILLLTIHFIISKSIHENVEFREGSNYEWMFQIIIAETSIGVLLNSFSLHLFFSIPNYHLIPLFSSIMALNFVNLLYTITILIMSSYDYSNHSHLQNTTECRINAMQNVFYFIWSDLIILLISYGTRIHLCHGKQLTSSQVLKFVIYACLYAGLVTILSINVPGTGYQLDVTGTYCFVYIFPIESATIFGFLGVILPTMLLISNLYQVFIVIDEAQKKLSLQGIETQAKGRYVKMVKKLLIIILTILLCESGIVTSAIYTWSMKQYPPTMLSAVSGIMGLLGSNILNPLLFFYLNREMRQIFYNKYGFLIDFMMCRKKPIKIHQQFSRNNSSDIHFYKHWFNVLMLKETLILYSKSNYTIENILFYDYYHKLQTEIDFLKHLLLQLNENEIITHQIIQLYNKIIEHIIKIYDLFIIIPTAPLEVYISQETRQSMNVKFSYLKTGHISFLESKSVSDINQLILTYFIIFDESYLIICKIIETDIFPRFQKTELYACTVQKYERMIIEL